MRQQRLDADRLSESFGLFVIGPLFAVGLLMLVGLLQGGGPSDAVFAQSRDSSSTRLWTDASGSFRVQAVLVESNEAFVRLRKRDGKVIRVPLDKLSEKDRRFVLALPSKTPSPPARSGGAAPGIDRAVPTAASTQDWPRWRGPQNNGKSAETGLLTQWDGEPPKVWQIRGLGKGYSSLAVADGRILTMGERDGGQFLIALDTRDGSELWATRVGDPGRDGPNGTPTVDGDRVYAIGINGDLLCAATEDGREVWRKNFARDFGGKMMSTWGFSESPLIDGDRLICTPGGPLAMVAALNKQNGEVIWTTPMQPGGQRGKDGAGYSSVVISNAAGVKQYVQVVGRAVIGVEAETGRPLWSYERIINGTANVPTPVVDGDYVFCSTGYGDGGTALLRIVRNGRQMAAREVYYHGAKELQNHHGGMILLNGYVYMGHGHNRGLPVCVELKTGQPAWGPLRGPGGDSAAITYADGHLYFRYQDGTMALIEATPREYRLKGKFKADFGGGPKWSHPVVAGGRLYLRAHDELACYDIRR